jgi:hypothetical protein
MPSRAGGGINPLHHRKVGETHSGSAWAKGEQRWEQ